MTDPARDRRIEFAKIREDLIRRLFAVTISVGFAATLAAMPFIQHATYPSPPEWEQIAILLTALVTTILSWDGYLYAIAHRPLLGGSRYLIDISLVFIYMVLLITSKSSYLWLPI
jgi:hypothetical protein